MKDDQDEDANSIDKDGGSKFGLGGGVVMLLDDMLSGRRPAPNRENVFDALLTLLQP